MDSDNLIDWNSEWDEKYPHMRKEIIGEDVLIIPGPDNEPIILRNPNSFVNPSKFSQPSMISSENPSNISPQNLPRDSTVSIPSEYQNKIDILEERMFKMMDQFKFLTEENQKLRSFISQKNLISDFDQNYH